MEVTTYIAGLSALAAIVSAVVAVRSSAASRRSARMAERQVQLTYQESVGNWEPAVDLEILHVSYRWSKRGMVWEEGEWGDPGVGPHEWLTLKDIASRGLEVEVVLTGMLIHHGARSALLTAHDHDPSSRRMPLWNQRVFLIDGRATRKAVIPPGVRKRVTWIDRRSPEEWQEHHIAESERNAWGDRELEPPTPSHQARIVDAIRQLRDPRYSRYLEWKAAVLRRSGFRLVIDTRAANRIPEVWDIQLGQSPLIPADRDEKTELLRWQVNSEASAPIDDEVVVYRCHRDMTFAQLETPRMRKVPGRF